MDVDTDRRLQQLETRLEQEESQRMALESELKDQQEAMDALMDMLEKTITVEVCAHPLARPARAMPLLARAMPFPSLRAR